MPSKATNVEGGKREKYTPRACNQCQRRKVKCSGELICTNCRTRQVECDYSRTEENSFARKPAKRSRTSRRTSSRSASPELSPRLSPLAELHDENKLLRQQVRQLQLDIEVLFRSRNIERRPSAGDAAVTESIQSQFDVLPVSTDQCDDQFATEGQEWTLLNGDVSTNETDGSPLSHCDADTFEASSPWPSTLAICSQISALRVSLGHEPSPREKKIQSDKMAFPIHLPEPESLQRLLQAFFREFDCYFPCIQRANMMKRFSEFLSSVRYSEFNVKCWVRPQHYKIAAILCSALAFGSPFITPPDTVEWRPGWNTYLHGKHLMQHFDGCSEDDLEIVIYHMLSAGFLLQAETLRFASHHVVQGYQSALNIGLNNQNQCNDVPSELASRKSLWWILYFLDKRITQKSGIAYFIRESEVAVEDFQHDVTNGTGGSSQAFLQSMITHSRLWTHVWDNFFAPHAPKAGNWDEIQMVDARIIILHQKNASQLQWLPEHMDQSRRNGETECQIRRRLLVYLVSTIPGIALCRNLPPQGGANVTIKRHKYLRLSIRHAKMSEDNAEMERRQSCFHLAKDIVEAVAQYMSFYSSYRPSGYVLTSSLVECIYHIVPQYREQSNSDDHQAIERTLQKAGSLLRTLSQTVGAASRALRALHFVLKSDGSLAESIYGNNALTSINKAPNWTHGLWDTPETRKLHDWLDGDTEEDQAVPASPTLLQTSMNDTMSTIPDGAWDYNPFHEPSPGSSFPTIFFDGATHNNL